MPTSTITLTINTPADVTIASVVDALSAYWGYMATLPNGTSNPQTKTQFVQSKTAAFLRDSWVAARANADMDTARISSMAASQLVTVA